MFDNATQDLLKKKLPGLPQLVAAPSLKHDIDELVHGALPPVKLAVVDDANAGAVLGDQVARALKAARVRLSGNTKADEATVEFIRRESAGCGALVAVGGGTINDLCKYAAFLDKKPYVVFPTAASMNGYVSANASISFEGYKKTCAAAMPAAVLCDSGVIAAAPPRLARSGLGDSLARPTAQADWLLSHLLLNTPYDQTPFDILKPLEEGLFEAARGIGKGDAASIDLLMRILLLSGLGMTIAGGSYPASQGEHMIAHAYEMIVASDKWQVAGERNIFHGEAIGVTALAMARRQEALMGIEPELLPDNFDGEYMTGLYGAQVAEEAKKSFAVKHQRIAGAYAAASLKSWPDIAGKLEKIMLPPARIEAILKAAEAPLTHRQLGWDDKQYMAASATARFLRDRFTFLDLT